LGVAPEATVVTRTPAIGRGRASTIEIDSSIVAHVRPGVVNELLDLVPTGLEMLLGRFPPAAQIGFDLIPALAGITSGRIRTKVVCSLVDGAQGLCHDANITP